MCALSAVVAMWTLHDVAWALPILFSEFSELLKNDFVIDSMSIIVHVIFTKQNHAVRQQRYFITETRKVFISLQNLKSGYFLLFSYIFSINRFWSTCYDRERHHDHESKI